MKVSPQRMCIVCKTSQDKKNLLRIVADSEGNIFLDKSQKANGRGAYICNKTECFVKCKKIRQLNRAFKKEISEEIYLSLEKEIFGQN